MGPQAGSHQPDIALGSVLKRVGDDGGGLELTHLGRELVLRRQLD
jgi:hypothetical protein